VSPRPAMDPEFGRPDCNGPFYGACYITYSSAHAHCCYFKPASLSLVIFAWANEVTLRNISAIYLGIYDARASFKVQTVGAPMSVHRLITANTGL